MHTPQQVARMGILEAKEKAMTITALEDEELGELRRTKNLPPVRTATVHNPLVSSATQAHTPLHTPSGFTEINEVK